MTIAVNPQSGEVVYLTDDGQWKPAQRAVNPDTREMLAFDGKDWSVVPGQHQGVRKYVDAFMEPFKSYLPTQTRMAQSGIDQMKQGWSDFTSNMIEPTAEVQRGPGEMAAGALEYLSSPINAAIDAFAGQQVEKDFGVPAQITDLAASLALPVPKELPRFTRAAPAAAPAAAAPARMMDVTLSEGQAGRNLPAIQREQAALRGTSGPPAQAAAQAFAEQQAGELAATRERLARSLDPMGSGPNPGAVRTLPRVAENPQQAGEIVQQGVQGAAQIAKADVDAAYKAARELPGEIHADVFRSMPQDIKTELSAGAEPVIIDDKLTPFASQMVKDLDQRVGQLRIQNRAQPQSRDMMPAGEEARIVGIDLKGVEQTRKRLSTMRGDAIGSGNAADARAARAVLEAFDRRIDAAVDAGQFTGDARAVNAWKAARAAHSDYRATFGSATGNKDPALRVVQKILGNRDNPAAIPNDVADFMYGSAGTNPASLNVAVVKRIQKILGDRSPEWVAVRQGLFSRLVETGEGMKDMGPAKVAERISRFLNADGREMANVVFSNSERAMLAQYADLMRHLEVPQAGANWSNTATFAGRNFAPSLSGRVVNVIGERVGMLVHAVLGRTAGTAVEIAARHVSEANAQAREAREIARMMPVIGNVTRGYTRAAQAAQISPTARNVARLTLAARNLSTNLQTIGVAMSPDDLLRALQGPTPATGSENRGTQNKK